MRREELAVVQGWADTKAALKLWHSRPSLVLRPWVSGSLLVALLLLLSTWAVAMLSTPDPYLLHFPGVTRPADFEDYGHVLFRNGLVLALHGLACLAGFIAGSSLPQVANEYTGVYRRIHEIAQPLAIGFVVAATTFSLVTQAYILGGDASSLAAQFGVSPAVLLGVFSLHAIPELTALFLPLAAWTIASRHKRWDELLAATFVTVGLAIPVLLLAAAIEVWVSPRVLIAVAT
jgi:hypothetical protein